MIDSNLYRKIEMVHSSLINDYRLTHGKEDPTSADLADHANQILHMSAENDLLEGILDKDREDDPEYKSLLLFAASLL